MDTVSFLLAHARRACLVITSVFGACTLGACSSSNDDKGPAVQGPASEPINSSQIVAADGLLEARIRRTTGGVPHVLADDLASVAFGSGYAQAQDNICLIAEAIVKVRGERSRFFGPGANDENVVSDFSYLGLRIHADAQRDYPTLSAESRTLFEGFAAGYNRYVKDTATEALPAACRAQPWVRAISAAELFAYNTLVARYASGDLFATGAMFVAAPPGVSADPVVVTDEADDDNAIDVGEVHERSHEMNSGPTRRMARTHWPVDRGALAARQPGSLVPDTIASNAWGIGRELSEQGQGALLANPHFPYTGTRRLYQVHLTVPDVIDVNGAGLIGVPLPLIGFNRHLAWSHTVSTSRRFTLYELTLEAGNELAYLKDDASQTITSEAFRIEVANGTPTPITLEKTFYYSEYGPLLAADLITGDGLPAWGANGTAYTFRDANADAGALVDNWLGLNRASSLAEFQAVFERCGSTLWTNTTYADDQGNAWYIDSSSVPNLSPEALQVLADKRQSSPLYEQLFQAGLTLLDGSTSRDDWVEGECGGRVPYAGRPHLLRSDFVQNSNASHWSANPAEFLVGYSPLFGSEATPINARTRLGLTMLQNPTDPGKADDAPAGQDGRFSARELLDVIWNNRGLYAETLLDELRARCDLIGTAAVNSAEGPSRAVGGGCAALGGWNGTYDLGSTGAAVFRVFMANYLKVIDQDLTTPFDAANPVNTPSDPSAANRGTADDVMLQSLARALNTLDAGGITYDAPLGEVQRYRPSGGALPGGEPVALAEPIAWHGGTGTVDGAFNAIGAVISTVAEDTSFARLNPAVLPDSEGLSAIADEGWWIARGTSWHFGLEFTQAGPEAWGLVSYSQSTDPDSPHFTDQSIAYSTKQPRRLLFNEADIAANLLSAGETLLTGQIDGASEPREARR